MLRRVAPAIVVALAISGSCTTAGPQQVGTQPSWRTEAKPVVRSAAVAAKPTIFAPDSAAAEHYNEPVVAPLPSPLGDATIAAVRDAALAAHLAPPIADARLFRACEQLAAIYPEEGVINYGVVEFALQRNGIIEPSPHLLVVWGNLAQPQVIVDQLKPKLAEIFADGATARLGIGGVQRLPDGTGAIVFALQGSGLATNPLPRSLPTGGSFAVDAVIDAKFHDPDVFVTRDDGTTDKLPLRAGRANAFATTVRCGDRAGKQQIEIEAADTAGATVLANFPVWCGTAPPLTMRITAPDDKPVISEDDAELRLFELVNRDRTAAGLLPLGWDHRVAAVARAHSEEMRRTKLVAHISPATGSAVDRVRAADIRTAVVLENVARAYGVNEAHDALMNSPGHRANLMSPIATHIGIGVVLGDEVSGRREMFVTQVFIRVTPKIDPATTTAQVRARLATARPGVSDDPTLDAIAHQLAEMLASGVPRDSAWAAVRRQLDAMSTSYARIGSVIEAVSELDSLDGNSLFDTQRPDALGIGVAQGPHPDIGDNAIWIVVLMADRVNPPNSGSNSRTQ